MKKLLLLSIMLLCVACSSSYEEQQYSWNTMSYTDGYEKLNSNHLVDLSSKIK